MKKLILLFLLLTAYTAARAQKQWTLRECIDYAVENNIDIKQSELNVKGAEIDLNTARNSRLPNLGAGVNQSLSFGQSVVRQYNADTDTYIDVYKDSQDYSLGLNVSTSIPVFAGFRINNQVKAGELDLKAATENLNKARENMELSVTSYYLEVLFRKEVLAVYRSQTELTAKQLERTEAIVEAGKAPRSQLYDMKAQLSKDKLNETTARNSLDLALLNLAQLLNIGNASGFDIMQPRTDEDIAGSDVAFLSADELYRTAIGIKPHVMEAQYRLESSMRAIKVAKADYWPTLSLSAGYNNGFSHIINGENFQSIKTQLRNRGNESISLNLSIPIFNRFATRNRVRAAHLNVRSRELELDNVKLAIYKEIQQAWQSAVAAQSKYTATSEAMDAAQEAYGYVEQRYEVGKATAYELFDAQSKLFSARSEQVQAKYDYIFRGKILDFYRGDEINLNY